MNIKGFYQRKNLRAPIQSQVLFEDEGHVFKCSLANISRGGVLIKDLSHFPATSIIGAIINVPHLYTLKSDDIDHLREVCLQQFSRKIFRCQLKTVRRDKRNVEDLFNFHIGAAFVDPREAMKEWIDSYVVTFAFNTVLLLRLLETSTMDEMRLEKIRLLAKMLGYQDDQKLTILRQQVTHDYKSLQWL